MGNGMNEDEETRLFFLADSKRDSDLLPKNGKRHVKLRKARAHCVSQGQSPNLNPLTMNALALPKYHLLYSNSWLKHTPHFL